MNKKLLILDFILLNLQISIGLILSFSTIKYFYIGEGYIGYIWAVVIICNILFIIFMKFQKVLTLKNFIIISLSASLVGFFTQISNKPTANISLENFVYMYIGSIFVLYLIISSPISLIIECIYKKRFLKAR
ncbi:hypothetical protein BFG52_07925 [Acinetobacter larvae]|uniref:Uncharacterized protein n=1 Tax=Acinetobacter larvae TaxID=1789224 RepID=A0A1B2LZT8_9GAMM|nr:hypothetical protein BFG52_07925 [Acinetobacter larvae]